ncbi:cytochrome P450 [Daldinia vernicosa]|uniref:cytochrome P450 n=1 Tax=Daldinia vernicosa TaxID=114800 RepID=UPI0020079F35|nr:cytochrome P450 [Daldinia vernicosa]KAI0853838.1 cytochrome P450 [Daldinia vernicosa]
MKDELLLFIYAGHDTTSVTLQWFVKFMTNNQEAQMKLRKALRTAFPGDSLPSITDLLAKNVPYLDAVIEESLRCGATATRIMRVATVDTEIFGHKIPAGTRLSAPATLMWHSMPVPEGRRSLSSRAAFEKGDRVDWTHTPGAQELDKFIPERWLKIDKDGKEICDPTTLAHNAFGGGIRGCFGKRLAMLELRITIALIVMSFKFLPIPPEFNSFQATEQLLRSPR